jgi:hypothetical protein
MLNHFAALSSAANASTFIVGAVFVIACIVVVFVSQWKVFVKAGRPGWAAIIPVYNMWVLFEISGKPGLWVLFGLIPYIGWVILFVLYINAALELARRFGKSTMFGVFGLVIFQIIGFIILAFGDAQYRVPPKEEQSFHAPTSD